MAEQPLPEDSTTHEDEDVDDQPAEVADEEPHADSAEPTPTSWALRGAFVGAIAGSATGAGLGLLFARRPEALTQARSAIGANGSRVARAAAVAAGEVMTSKHLNQLLQGEGNGDRGESMKQAAKEAGVAAATAARDTIISLRSDPAGLGSRREGGGNGAGS